MDLIDNETFDQSSSSPNGKDDKVEAVDDLLEKCWFFDNLLINRRTKKMFRCYSDLCPSSSFSQEEIILPKNSNTPEEEKKKEIRKLTRQLSDQTLPQKQKPITSCLAKKEGDQAKDQAKESDITRRSKLTSNLQRTQTLPSYIGREDDTIQDKESDARMSKLILEALASSSEILPRRQPSKVMTQNISAPRYRPPKNSELQNINANRVKEMKRRYLNQKAQKKSLTDLELEEVQGFKDLGFTFNKQDLSPNVVNILPGLQDKKQEDLNQDKVVIRRPYLSEAWLEQSCSAPPIPSCVAKNSAEDMKAQIKFWARAVATNVGQEC